MRITIDTDDQGKVNIDTGEKGAEKPGLFESTTDIPVIDAGPAPVQEIERQRNVTTAAEGGRLSASLSPEEREAQLPLNPLRAGAAAAYQNPANLRKMAAASEGTFAAAQEPSIATVDGGAAPTPEGKESSETPTPEQQSAKGEKGDKKY